MRAPTYPFAMPPLCDFLISLLKSTHRNKLSHLLCECSVGIGRCCEMLWPVAVCRMAGMMPQELNRRSYEIAYTPRRWIAKLERSVFSRACREEVQ